MSGTIGDREIRRALYTKRLRARCQNGDTLVVNELGLAHARSRIDMAMINGTIHGFEIKSAQDSLDRLPAQLDIYSQSLQKLTLVVAPRHLERTIQVIPAWCGVLEVRSGPRGGLSFGSLRKAVRNPGINRFLMAHLLWRDEVQRILVEKGLQGRTLRAPRKELYRALVEMVSETELTELIKTSMMQRPAWRDHLQPQ